MNPYAKFGYGCFDSTEMNKVQGKTSVAIKSQLQPLLPRNCSPSPMGDFRHMDYIDSASGCCPTASIPRSVMQRSDKQSIRSGSIKRPIPQADLLLNAWK